jgi:hypothetical protein
MTGQERRVSSNSLGLLSVDELLVECANAADNVSTDREGSIALLDEAKRRLEIGELDPAKFELVSAVLKICRNLSFMDIVFFSGHSPTHPWQRQRQALRVLVGEQPLDFVYHGTLRSRLLSIARDGLIPAKRPKRWFQTGVTEHAATGVFFERNWRRALRWVGPAAYDKDLGPVKGAIIRVPVADLIVEKDIRSEGSLVIRQDRIPLHEADVLLFPFTVTARWMPIDAVIQAY